MTDIRELKRRVGQRFIVGFEGTRLPNDLIRMDEEWGLGGVILFSRNLQEFDQVLDLTEQLWSLGGGIPPFVGIDQEGGPVHRLPEPFTVFPEMSQLGVVNSVSLAYEVGAVSGRELTAAGFNLNFAPVLDIDSNPENPIIGKRAISSDPAKVANLGRAVIRGLHDNAIVACGKHFPGHGDTSLDSHVTLPESNQDLDRMRECEWVPYQAVTQKAPHLDLVMTAHVNYPKLDPERPATFSRTILQDMLRLELGYKGSIVTDDLEMKAVTDNWSIEEAVVMALEAGVEIFLICRTREQQILGMETLLKMLEQKKYPKHLWERSFKKIHDLKARHFRVVRSIDRAHAREVIGNREHQRIARRLRDGK